VVGARVVEPTPLLSEEPQHRNGIDLRGVFPVAMRSSRNTLEGAARLAGRSGPGLGEISDAALVLWLDPRRKQPNRVLILQHRQSANRRRWRARSASPRGLVPATSGVLCHIDMYVADERGKEGGNGPRGVKIFATITRSPGIRWQSFRVNSRFHVYYYTCRSLCGHSTACP